MKRIAILLVLLCACSALMGCLVVGYSTRGGFFVWPGSIAITLVLLLLWLFFRNR